MIDNDSGWAVQFYSRLQSHLNSKFMKQVAVVVAVIDGWQSPHWRVQGWQKLSLIISAISSFKTACFAKSGHAFSQRFVALKLIMSDKIRKQLGLVIALVNPGAYECIRTPKSVWLVL